MPELHIDGRAYTVADNQSVLEAALGLGFHLPYFCWHPAMGSVGACRQCAVLSGEGHAARLVMSCMTPVADGLHIAIEDPRAADFRRSVIEGLMLHHPHDCPVCDEGGHCHLQDMTVMAGHDYRRYRFPKRTFRNQYLGPLVNHEMNRCIQCYRCVRFYREYAGGTDFNVAGISDRVFFGRAVGGAWRDGVFESEFAGNLAEVCPTGVFTDATLKQHYTRKWDLRWTPSVCPFCSRGCNISPGERYGSVRVVVNRLNPAVNGYFLCDRGRFGYEYLNSPQRVRRARPGGAAAAALERLHRLLDREEEVAAIGSPRASLESNLALRRLVGKDRFFGASEPCVASPVRAEECDAALILGEDLTQTAARLALSIRQLVRNRPLREICDPLHIPHWLDHAAREAIQDARGPLHILTPAATRLDDIAASTLRAAPDDLARRGFAVADAIARGGGDDPVARDLLAAERPLVVAGSSLSSPALAAAAAAIVAALQQRGRRPVYKYIPAAANSFGLSLLEPRPLRDILERARYGHVSTLFVLEADLARLMPPRAAEEAFARVRHLVVLDQLESATTRAAEILLPAAAWTESEGTFVNADGLAQRFFRVLDPDPELRASWEWLELARGHEPSLEDLLAELPWAQAAAPGPDFRVAGQKIAREPQRYSGRTAMTANIAVSEPKPPDDPNAPLTFTMEGYAPPPPRAVTPFFWAPGWNSPQAQVVYPNDRAGSTVEGAQPPPPGAPPPPFTPRPGHFWLLRHHHLFGSEELSRNGRAIASLAPAAYVGVPAGPQWTEGQTVALEFEGEAYELPLRFIPGLAQGLAVVPAGFAAFDGVELPTWCRIAPYSPASPPAPPPG